MSNKEPQSYQECIAVLDEYRDKLDDKQYEIVASSIGNHAIDEMYCDRDDIDRMVRAVRGEITEEQAMAELKEMWGINE